ncbi:hypothetical protein Lser_V15G01255 [Lactuca serriola]
MFISSSNLIKLHHLNLSYLQEKPYTASNAQNLTMNSNSNPISSDQRWILTIRQAIDEDIEEDTDIPVSIFNVPIVLVSTKPESYIPQQVALGPYHHWRPELYEMERYKLSAAKRCQKLMQDGNVKFQQIVDQFVVFEPKIRACYHKYLNFDGETLAWMMSLDVSFLLEFLDVYNIEKGRLITRVASRMSHLVDFSCRKFGHDAILRDIVMLENQIPMSLLEKMLEFKFKSQSPESTQKYLTSTLLGLHKELSPFTVVDQQWNLHSSEDCAHVLGFLYHMIIDPNIKQQWYETTNEGHDEEQVQESRHKFQRIINAIQNFVKRLISSEPVKLLVNFPLAIISNTSMVRILKQQVCYDEDKQISSVECISKPPLMEEISIPSVTELVKAGFGFSPSSGGILTIDFDNKTSKLFLPIVSFDVNTDVVLRNLVAYEVCKASGPLILTRYIELMNGIIDTKEDVKLLREMGIIKNRLKSDEEVANLWNGMSRCVRLTKLPFLDTVIEDVNRVYEGKWRVKIGKLMKVYVLGSWQFLVFVAVVMVLFLMSLEVTSSIFRCIFMFFIRSIV